ncbi:MAG TPA: DUF167 domain-containing protein [Cyclobacteriaceae bacterium]|nr:DUF167 domain-containing protein [Cyclobacteriaceae bacterium]
MFFSGDFGVGFDEWHMVLVVKVKPNSRANKLSRENGVLTIRIHAPAQEGKANKAIVEFLSEVMDIPKSYIEIVGGLTSANKRLSIHDKYTANVEAVINKLD